VKNSPGLPVGDVVISIDTAIRQAREYRVTPSARLRRLLIHGFLHLIGYDHERSPADARRMFARERTLAARMEKKASDFSR
jgi:probable rRNA maturation factor